MISRAWSLAAFEEGTSRVTSEVRSIYASLNQIFFYVTNPLSGSPVYGMLHGGPSQVRTKKQLSKRQLEIQLSRLKILEKPSLKLEQYPVSSEAASELLYLAGFEHDDLNGRVIDLGTGTGRLAIGAVLMGADEVVGVDVDAHVLVLAKQNADTVGVHAEWVQSDIEKINERFDAVLMNPPYGTRTARADTRFLEKAFQLAPVVYSIHKSATRQFLVQFVTRLGWDVGQVRSMRMAIPHLFEFHEKKRATVEVDLYRIVRKTSN
jgi:predicted RNA methylase